MEPNENPINDSEMPEQNQANVRETANQAIVKKPRKIIFISIIAFLIIAGLAGAFYFSNSRNKTGIKSEEDSINNQSQKGLEKGEGEFSYSECKGDDMFPDYIKEVKWENDRLIIRAVANQNCAVKKISGKSEVSGNNIVLNIEGTSGEMMAMCDCDYDVEFNLKGLSKMDYNIVLNTGGKDLDKLTLKMNGEVSDMCDQDRSYACYAKNLSVLQNPQLAKNTTSDKIVQLKEFVYDTEENKKIAESNPDFLRLFKKFEIFPYESDSYDTFYLSFNKENKYIKLKAGRKGQSPGMETGLISDVNSFQEGINKYVAEKKSLESPNSLQAQLKARLGIEVTRAHENEAGFDFIYNGENITYWGPFEGESQKGSLEFSDRKGGGNKFIFLSGFPYVSQIDKTKLIELVDISNKVYQLIKNNLSIALDSVYDASIKQTEMKARFSAQTNPEIENNLRHMTIHNFDIPIKDPIQKKYELNINSGEFKVLANDENVDEF